MKPLKEALEIPEGVSVEKKGQVVTMKGSAGTIIKTFRDPTIKIAVADGKIKIVAEKQTKSNKMFFGTTKARLKNMISGAMTNYIYTLKICSGHFPMNVSLSGQEFIIKNFLGEKVPRKIILPPDVKVNVKGKDITIESPDKERAGTVASSIEKLTRMTRYDRRIFQDGIYITEKAKQIRK